MVEQTGQIPSGMDALMRQYMTTSNNIANVNTAGFKRSISSFSTDLSRQLQNKNLSLSAGQINVEERIDFSQGAVISTGRPLDVALEGKGFIALETPNGPLYTRAGSLNVNSLGQLVDAADRMVAGQNGPIVIPRDVPVESLHISTDGTLLAKGQELGKLKIVEFPEGTKGLSSVGFGAYQAGSEDQPLPAKDVRVRQGFQENSNVRIMEEVVSLMTLSRIYESHMNILKKKSDNSNAMLGVANG